MLSDVMEDYLKAIYILERKKDSKVTTSALADHLDVTAPSVTSMLEKLDKNGLAEYQKYKGVSLTPEGKTIALEVLRHHRLLETYLTERLDFQWTAVHEEADTLEHYISEEFEERIANVLNNPRIDPHGDPIPSADLDPIDEEDTLPLTEFNEGETVEIARLSDRDQEELEYLADLGLTPGTIVEIDEIAPIGMYTLSLDNTSQNLPVSIANSIRCRAVQPVNESC
ncbi:MAG: metal-dependent transcriptional regulator [Halobacteriaceae archaeon]